MEMLQLDTWDFGARPVSRSCRVPTTPPCVTTTIFSPAWRRARSVNTLAIRSVLSFTLSP